MKRARCLLFVLILVYPAVVLPGETVHTVSPGDTLYSLARRFGVSVEALTDLNRVSPANLRIGMRLRIPGRGAAASEPAARSQARTAGASAAGTIHTVRAGDTAYGLCRRHGLRLEGFLAANGLKNPALRIGQRVRLTDRPAAVASSPGGRNTTVKGATAEQPRATGRTPAATSTAPARPARTSPGASVPALVWPLRGSIVEKFGVGSRHINNGITIRATPGDPVRAAADGTVVYSGTQRGYGNLVMVRHGQTVYTVYAHLQERLVAVDGLVRKGQVIGKAGAVPSAGVNGLHFQVYEKTRAIDPLLCLR